jgi:hypothetical protein
LKRALTALVLASTLVGCASGPKLADAQADLPKLAESQGRIYFYRTQVLTGLVVQPSIYLNGQKVADCAPQGVFITDAPPGDYEATTATEVEHKVSFSLAAGEEKFVRCHIGIGLFVGHAILDLVNADKAHHEMRDLAFAGRGEVPVAAK